jgi:hypothetical protein
MASLTGQTIDSTYDSLLKVTDNGPITSSLKIITDGLGNNTALSLSSTNVQIDGNFLLNPASTPNLVTALFTQGGSDPNFRAGFSNGSGSTIGSEHAKVGMWYGTSGNPVSHLGFLRGGGANSDGITFNVNNIERMRINEIGNVGIGTTSPSQKLEVSGSGLFGIAKIGNWASGVTFARFGHSSYDGDTTFGYIQSSISECYINGSSNYLSATTNNIFETGGFERMRITNAGEVYIGGTADQGSYNLQVNGTGVWGAGAYVNGSDLRLKNNISEISPALDLVNKLKPVSYKYNEDYSKDQSVQSGFIAQDLQDVFKDEVYVDGLVIQGPEYLSVAYQNLIPILVKAIQEQQLQIEELKLLIKK